MSEAQQAPNNLRAERALLGIILNNNESLFAISGRIRAGDFFEAFHGTLFDRIRIEIESGRSASCTTIMHDLAQDIDLGGVQKAAYIDALSRDAPSPAVALDLARTVAEASLRRRLLEAGEMFMSEVRKADVSIHAADLRNKYDTAFSALFASTQELGIRSIGDIGKSVLESVAAGYKKAGVGLDLGLAALQNLTGPLLPGRLYLIAGAPGSGKSGLVQQIAERIAKTEPVLWFEAEMPGEEVTERSMAGRSGVSAEQIERSLIDANEYLNLQEAVNQLRTLQLFIDASSSPSIPMIRSKAVRQQRLAGLSLLILDNLQYAAKEPRQDQFEAIRQNLQGLKAIAKDLDIPVLVVAGLKKEFADGPIRRPHVGDIFGGSAIDQEADCIVIIHREEYMLGRREPSENDASRAEWLLAMEKAEGKAEFILCKRRGGKPTGVSTCGFDGARFRFLEQRPKSTKPAPVGQFDFAEEEMPF